MLKCPIEPTAQYPEFVQLAIDLFSTDTAKSKAANVKVLRMSDKEKDKYDSFHGYQKEYVKYIMDLRAYNAQERQKLDTDRKKSEALKASDVEQQKESAESNERTFTQYKDLSDQKKKSKDEREEQRQKSAGDQPKKKGGFFKKIFGF